MSPRTPQRPGDPPDTTTTAAPPADAPTPAAAPAVQTSPTPAAPAVPEQTPGDPEGLPGAWDPADGQAVGLPPVIEVAEKLGADLPTDAAPIEEA